MPRYFLPHMQTSADDQGGIDPELLKKRGITITAGTNPAGIAKVGAGWYHNWSPTPTPGASASARFIPTAWRGQIIKVSPAYSIIFWANEPNNRVQAGVYDEMYDPARAAERYKKAYLYHGTKLWPAGVCSPDSDWFDRFLEAVDKLGVPLPQHFHVHGYAEDCFNLKPDGLFKFWTRLHDLLPAPGTCIVSEFGSTDGDAGKMREMVAGMEATTWIDGYAAFSLEIDTSKAWYPGHWLKPCPMNLIEGGELTELGQAYIK